jgi:transcriptional regulator GlxA family with amidase domain
VALVESQACAFPQFAGSGELVIDGIVLAMNVTLLAMQGAADLGLSAVLDTLETANELAVSMDSPPSPLAVSLVGVGRRVSTGRGFVVPVGAANSAPRPDAVVLPALSEAMPAGLLERLSQKDVAKAGGMLREWSQDGAWIGAACTGTFVLAESTLLDGHGATTSWWLAPVFRQRYLSVRLDESRMLVSSGPFVTAGAALAHVDLALGLIRRHSPGLAALTARYLLVEPRVSQAAFVIPDHLAHNDPLVERFEAWARRHIKQGFSLAGAARSVGTSERTLDRRLRAVLGKSPLSYFQDLRVERAVHLLQTSKTSVEAIAAEIGYSDGVTLRSLLRRKLGRGVREIRSQGR